jgi:hypothetical protein
MVFWQSGRSETLIIQLHNEDATLELAILPGQGRDLQSILAVLSVCDCRLSVVNRYELAAFLV